MDGRSQPCARARLWVSLRLDGELSELEQALLDAHVRTCAGCRAFADAATGFSALLRAARLEPAPLVPLHPRYATRRTVLAFAAAAVLAIAAIGAGLVHSAVSHTLRRPATPRTVAVVASVETPDQFRRLRRTTIMNQRYVPRDLSDEIV
jgi:hypothetical protein